MQLQDGASGSLRGSLQPHHPLRPAHLLQLGAQAALQEHLLLLPAAHLQAEGGEAPLRRRNSHHRHLQIYPRLQLRGVQLSGTQRHPPPPHLPPPPTSSSSSSKTLQRTKILLASSRTLNAFQRFEYWIRKLNMRVVFLERQFGALGPVGHIQNQEHDPLAFLCFQSGRGLFSRPDTTNCCSPEAPSHSGDAHYRLQ